MKRSCFAFDLNSCLNIFSFFFFIFNSNSYKSVVFVSFVSVSQPNRGRNEFVPDTWLVYFWNAFFTSSSTRYSKTRLALLLCPCAHKYSINQ